jgi:hypothetical protein
VKEVVDIRSSGIIHELQRATEAGILSWKVSPHRCTYCDLTTLWGDRYQVGFTHSKGHQPTLVIWWGWGNRNGSFSGPPTGQKGQVIGGPEVERLFVTASSTAVPTEYEKYEEKKFCITLEIGESVGTVAELVWGLRSLMLPNFGGDFEW